MPRGTLDDINDVDESDESFRKPAASSEWLKGTSRDLLAKAEGARAEPADMAKPESADPTDIPAQSGTADGLDGPRNDGRDDGGDDAVRGPYLDDVSKSVVQEIKSELAQPGDSDLRERAPIQEWLAMREEATETNASQLDIAVPAAVADSTVARAEHGDAAATSIHDNSELLASLRTTLDPMLIAAQQELMREVVGNVDYKAQFVSGAAGLAGVHATELAHPVVDLLHRDMAGATEGFMSVQEHVSGLIEAVRMFRDGLEFPVTSDELRRRAEAISEWWKTLHPPPEKPGS